MNDGLDYVVSTLAVLTIVVLFVVIKLLVLSKAVTELKAATAAIVTATAATAVRYEASANRRAMEGTGDVPGAARERDRAFAEQLV